MAMVSPADTSIEKAPDCSSAPEEVDQLTFVVEGHIVGGAVHILGVVQPVE